MKGVLKRENLRKIAAHNEFACTPSLLVTVFLLGSLKTPEDRVTHLSFLRIFSDVNSEIDKCISFTEVWLAYGDPSSVLCFDLFPWSRRCEHRNLFTCLLIHSRLRGSHWEFDKGQFRRMKC